MTLFVEEDSPLTLHPSGTLAPFLCSSSKQKFWKIHLDQGCPAGQQRAALPLQPLEGHLGGQRATCGRLGQCSPLPLPLLQPPWSPQPPRPRGNRTRQVPRERSQSSPPSSRQQRVPATPPPQHPCCPWLLGAHAPGFPPTARIATFSFFSCPQSTALLVRGTVPSARQASNGRVPRGSCLKELMSHGGTAGAMVAVLVS